MSTIHSTEPASPAQGLAVDGIVNIDKPGGLTSHDVVARVRRITGQRKAGHAGTLDPMATGVLPVALGKATRLIEYLSDADKAYTATITLGATSYTLDREGVIAETQGAVMPSRQEVEVALGQFRGPIEQVPPMHSAIKVEGRKLYDLARAGVELDLPPRPVTIHRLDLEAYDPPTLSLFVECSKGTYIRALARDLGAALGTGAYLAGLVRTRHGPFTLEEATTLEGLESAFKDGTWRETLFPPDYIIKNWPTCTPGDEERQAIAQGKYLALPQPGPGELGMMAAKTADGELLAVLRWDEARQAWHPKKVFVADRQPPTTDH